MHALLITQGTGGDLAPFLGMGAALKARGHQVTLLTHCAYEGIARQAGFAFVALDSRDEFERFIADGPLLNSPRGYPTFFERHILPHVLRQVALLRQHCTAETIIVARHLSDLASLLIAETLGVPLVRVFTAAAQVPALPVLEMICQSIFAANINAIRAQLDLAPVNDWSSWLRQPQRSIALWPDWFAAPEPSWPAGVVPVGFVTHADSETGPLPVEVQALLHDEPRPMLISAGTGTFISPTFYEASAEACRRLNRRALLVTAHAQQIPANLPAGVHWFARLPFASVIPHVAAVIHHGGTGTAARAMAAAVPQLLLAVGGDRPDTALHIQQLGVAEYLPPPHWQPELIALALARLLDAPLVQEHCRSVAARFNASDPALRACTVIEEVVRAGRPLAPASTPPAWCGSDSREPLSAAPAPKPRPDLAALSPERRALLELRLKQKRAAIKAVVPATPD